MKVGIRLKRLREAKGLSQRQLGKRAGIANATISMIERDQISPSVGSLSLLVDALGVNLHGFFAPESPDGQTAVGIFRRGTTQDDTVPGVVRRLLAFNDGGAELQLQYETYAPGADSGSDRHRQFEAGMVVRGEIELSIGGNTSLLQAGDAYHLNHAEPHRLRNQAAQACEIFSVCTFRDPRKA